MTYRLYGAPAPFPTESPNSWLQRIAHRYDMSFSDLQEAVGARWEADIDVSISRVGYGSIARTCGRPASETNLMYSIFCLGLGAQLARADREGRPIYGFCIGCFREDKVPFLRIEWRLTCWTVCPVHQVPLRSFAARCSAPWTMDRAVLRERRSKARSLAHCQVCGRDQRKFAGDAPSPTWKFEAALGRAVVSALASGHAEVIRGDTRTRVSVDYMLTLIKRLKPEDLVGEPYINLVVDRTKGIGVERRLARQRSGLRIEPPSRVAVACMFLSACLPIQE